MSNELGCHNGRCWCDVSAAAFRRWLADRYGDIEKLNDAWGTTFWSQHYATFDEVLPPRITPAVPNPTQQLDFARFSSDALLDYHRAERDVLRQHSTVPVTTNFMISEHQSEQDYFAWAPDMDVVSQDHYLDHRLPHPRAEQAFADDLTRGVAGGSWLLMESATSAVNWQPVNVAKRPGELLVDSLRHVARGADGVGFFQWRASRAGGEKYHSALVPHAGPDSARFREVVALGAALKAIGEVAGAPVAADVALLWDWNAWWACDQDSHPSGELRYVDAPQRWHRALTELGATVDVVHPSADLSAYRLVVVPTLYLCSDALAPALEGVVARGGHVLVTYFSGIVDEHDHVRLGGYPGAFRALLGVRVRGVRAAAHAGDARRRLRRRPVERGADRHRRGSGSVAPGRHARGHPQRLRVVRRHAAGRGRHRDARRAGRRRRGCAARGGRAGGRRDRPQGPVPVRAQRQRLPRRGARRRHRSADRRDA